MSLPITEVHSSNHDIYKLLLIIAVLEKLGLKWQHLGIVMLLMSCYGCKKLVTVPEPVSSVTTTEALATDAQANSALAGIYTQMISLNSPDFCSGALSYYCGMSADELIDYQGVSDETGFEFNSNALLSTNGAIFSKLWTTPYRLIYSANAIISGLPVAHGIDDSAKNEMMGEAKFIRGFLNFYLTNLFGDVPLVLTTDWNSTNLIARSSQNIVYNQIVSDLVDAQKLLPANFSAGQNERIRPNKWAASALLARVYLYAKDYQDAESQATAVINSGQFALNQDLNSVFLKNSSETIWQLQVNNMAVPYFNSTADGYNFIPQYATKDYDSDFVAGFPRYFIPVYYLAPSLVNAFETGDKRFTSWVHSTGNVNGVNYYYAFKDTVSITNAVEGGPVPQNYMVMRLAEMYLIRAEVKLEQAETGVVDDLNIIRNRAGLLNYTGGTDKSSLTAAIVHERQVELFTEWGHRWFDLKRLGIAVSTLSGSKGLLVSANSLAYPIPLAEISVDPNLTQNSGY